MSPSRPNPLIAFAMLLVLAGCEANTAPAAKTERPVQVQRVAFENENAAREFVGVVRARYETDLGFRVAGKMVARLVNVGDRVRAGDVVARLDPQDLKLQVQSAEAELSAAESNLAQAAADHERSFNATLRELSPQADPASRTYAARFTIKDADDTVAFGMTATVTLTRATDAPVARLPLSAILNRGTGPMVYLVDEAGALVQRPVTVASFTEDTALVTSGLNAGDRIVTLGVQKLEAGLKVRTIELR